MTDLPYGRGGSPLQNLILNKVYETRISAIKVQEGMDTGKIYFKEPFDIGLGNAEEIFEKASELVFNKMIPFFIREKPIPQEQEGDPVYFRRRKPEDSDLTNADIKNLKDIFDFIRMLDGEGYPNAFIRIGNLKITLSEVHKKNMKLTGRFEILMKNKILVVVSHPDDEILDVVVL